MTDYRDKIISLVKIKNENKTINFNWELWAAEVDLLSISINGKKSEITNEDIEKFLSGVLDSIILKNITNADKREQAILAQRKSGKSEDYIISYLKGWDSISEINL